jgi:putative tryptophan/tyrosine transport system substrate-binding protein
MRRREVITLLSGAVAAWPLATRAQQAAMPVIGYLHAGSEGVWRPFIASFVQGLQAAGYLIGRNVEIEYRWAEGVIDRLPSLAAELVGRKVSVIAASGGGNDAPLAAKAATSTIPIVFTVGTDPVKAGLVTSLTRPEGNVTGVSILNSDTQSKRLELARELVPDASTVFMLGNPHNPNTAKSAAEMQLLVQAGSQNFQFVTASTPAELDSAFERVGAVGKSVLIVAIDPFFNDRSSQITSLAAQHRVPAVYYQRGFMLAGGLASYGGNTFAAYKLAGEMAGKILSGSKPQEMPVQQSVKFELVLNLKTAKALGLTIPSTLLAIADEVIE